MRPELLCFLLLWQAPSDTDASINILRKQLSEDWATLQRIDEEAKRYTVRRQEKTMNDGKIIREFQGKFTVILDWAQGYRLFEGTAVDDRGGDREESRLAIVRNPHYIFAAQSEIGKDWTLRAQDRRPAAQSSLDQIAEGDGYLFNPLSTSFETRRLVEILEDPNFQIIAIGRSEENSVSLKFSYRFLSRFISKWIDVEGEMILEPRWLHAMRETRTKNYRILREFAEGPNGQPLCRSVDVDFAPQPQRFEFSDYVFSPIQKSRFRMAHYGFPEPTDQESPSGHDSLQGILPVVGPTAVESNFRVPKFVWIILAAIAIGSAAYLCRWLGKRSIASHDLS